MPSTLFRPRDRPLLNLALLGLTLLTTFSAQIPSLFAPPGPLLFSISLLLILGAHEMGHYILARVHRVDTTLPYFIPLPIVGVGTLGAVIRIRGPIPNRNALVDIGAAGPIAGLLVAIPVILYGMAHSSIVDAPHLPDQFPPETSLWALVPRLLHFLVGLVTGADTEAAKADTQVFYVFGDNLLMWTLRHLVLGPLPPGKDVAEHPMVIAGWFGLLVTMLNLLPIGQLDGGHISYAVFGQRARSIGKAMALLMFGLCVFYSAGWLLWLLVTAKLIGFRHPPVLEPEPPLTPLRKWTCIACLVGLIVCVMPVPITILSAP
jgi:membrane-associated protease RseP (regulator of RpoE activity)